MSFLQLQSGTPERHRLIGLRPNPGRLWRAVKWSGPQVQVERASECLSVCVWLRRIPVTCVGEETQELVLFNDSEGVFDCVCWTGA